MIRRLFALVALFSLLAGGAPALAQSDTGEIDIAVQDASTKAPIALARVMLDGPVLAAEASGANGKVRFTDVPDGIYRARVFARGYQAVTSPNFEVTDGRAVTVSVALAESGASALKTIATVVAKSTATITTASISSDSAQRKLSNSLADALGKLSGVTVNTSSSDSDATQTVSLDGQDPSQTAMTVDGIPLNAPGTAGDMRMMNSDLFRGASVSFGPQIGGLAGGVNFRTLDPTLSWQSEFDLSVGSMGKNNYSAAESGSIGKLGIAAMHTYREAPSLLDGMRYLDTSGLDYTHEGDGRQIGSMLKLRYEISDAQTLTGMYMHSTNGAELICTQDTGPVPCGYGPGNSYGTQFDLYSLTDNALIGDTTVQAALFGMRSNATHDLLDRYIAGVAAPTGTAQSMQSGGFSVSANLPAQQRHVISVNAYGTSSRSSFTPLTASAAPYTFPGQSASYAAFTVNDTVHSNAKLQLNESAGLSRASNSGGSLLLGAGAMWSPDASDSYALRYNIGGVAPHAGRAGILTEPGQLRIDCNGDIAYGSAPGDEPGASSSSSAQFSYTRRMRAGLVSASLYRQVQRDVVLPVDVNGTALTGIFPPGYWSSVQNVFNANCGGLPAAFGPQDVYYSTPIAGVQRVYEGARLNGFFQIGNLVLEPYYNLQVAKAISGDPRFDNPYAITVSGNQLPNVPLHRAGITLDYKAPHSAFEWLADANYTSANNQQNLPAFTTVDAGVSAQLQRGSLTLAMSNIFNAYAGLFAGSQNAVPYTTASGVQIATIARPNTPRQLALTYTVRFGQNVQAAPSRNVGAGPRERGGFRRFIRPLPATPPADPFAVSASPRCSASAQKTAQSVLAGLKAYAARIQAAKTAAGYPQTMPPAEIPGIAVTYHGMQSTYALTIAVKQPEAMRAMFGCTQFHITDMQTAQQRGLYVEQSGGMFFRPAVTFMPTVGFYFVRRPPQAGAESFRVYKLPASAPKTPFALRTSTTCNSDMKGVAQQMLSQLQAHFGRGAATPGWTITPHAAASGTWYALEPADVSAVPAIINCARVAAAQKSELTQLGWDGAPPPTLSYAPKLGLYFVMPERRFRGPGARPTPKP